MCFDFAQQPCFDLPRLRSATVAQGTAQQAACSLSAVEMRSVSGVEMRSVSVVEPTMIIEF